MEGRVENPVDGSGRERRKVARSGGIGLDSAEPMKAVPLPVERNGVWPSAELAGDLKVLRPGPRAKERRAGRT